MINFFKKPLGIVIIFILVFGAIAGWAYFGREQKPKYEFIIAGKRDLLQEVSVTGRIKPAESVNLAFEKSGKVIKVLVDVGNYVSAGETLIVLENTELFAQLREAEANVKVQQAKLEELKKGTRPEEIQISETKVLNAQKTIADAETNLENVKNKADVDLRNLYDDVKDILADAYNKADDAINKQTDEMFSNDLSSNPQLTFTAADGQTESDAELKRIIVADELKEFKTELDNLGSAHAGLDEEQIKAVSHLTIMQDFLVRLNDAVNSATGLSQTTISAYKTNINTGRANINTAISNINEQKQLILAQKATNQNNISSAEAKVNEAKNALDSAQRELNLKRAGYTSEQIAGQEAQLEQAKAKVENLKIQLAKTILRAPIDGVVTKQDAKVGEIVSANTSIISLISESQFEIEANIPEADISKIKAGDSAAITLDAYGSDIVFEAKVAAIEPAETIIEGVATYKTTIQFLKKDERIKSGMTANIDIIGSKREGVVAIPQRAIITRNLDKFARILNTSGEANEVRLITGFRSSDGYIEIIEGIKEGDKVIIYGRE